MSVDTPLGVPDHRAAMSCDQVCISSNSMSLSNKPKINSGGSSNGPFRQVIHQWGKAHGRRENGTIFVKHLHKNSLYNVCESDPCIFTY